MKAFVTGSTGFLGIQLVQELAKAGWEVTALHRASSDLTELKKLAGVRFAVGDVTDRASVERGMPPEVDAVFHVAGSVMPLPHHQEYTRYAVNQTGTQNAVESALQRKARRFIQTSTVLTYDFTRGGRLTEEYGLYQGDDAYMRSKRLADAEVAKGMSAGLDAVYLHPSAIFGAYDKATWSKLFLEIERGLPLPFAPPGGSSVAHMRKVAQAHVAAYHRGRKGEHYILGGPDVTWFDVVQRVAALLNRPGARWVLPSSLFLLYGHVEYRLSTWLGREPAMTPHTAEMLRHTILSDSSKAIRELGYDPSSLEEMLMDCYRWMVATGRLPDRTSEGKTEKSQ
ncbi:MAG: NAD-dependent epimerase/dehydratase family protein [Elusimicrobia bacterium]|nr:NAD-dependent epimerase/dehydratase family protein [Elusimicrobiota bacterium]